MRPRKYTADQGALVGVLHGPEREMRRSWKWGRLQAVHWAAGLADQLTLAEDFVASNDDGFLDGYI